MKEEASAVGRRVQSNDLLTPRIVWDQFCFLGC